MSKRRNLAIIAIVGIALIISVVFNLSFRAPTSSSSDANIEALGSPPAFPAATATVSALATVTVEPLITSIVMYKGTPVTVINRRHILAGKSPDEIAEFVVRKVAPNFIEPRGPIQVRISRPVSREEMPKLGLGCLPDNSGIEEPPYVLVILKGDFAPMRIPGRMQLPTEGRRYPYAALIMDVWMAVPATIINSADGSQFREILNDPSLPEATPQPQPDCPPYTPGTYPHGAIVPGVVFPTAPPAPTSTIEVVPPPVPTPNP